jgi:hypothetical protein
LYGAFSVKGLFPRGWAVDPLMVLRVLLTVLRSERESRSSFFNRAAGVKGVLSASGLRRIVVSPLVGRHWRNAVSLFG